MSKVKPTDFAIAMNKYLFEYLPEQRGLSEHTIQSYTNSLFMFLDFCESELRLNREKIEVTDITRERVEQFLDWLENTRGVSVATRNNRRIAINGLFKYLQYLHPGYVLLCQQILSIPHKTGEQRTINHISVEAVQAILKQPNLSTHGGRRDFAMLSLMYEAGARVSEIVNFSFGDLYRDKDGMNVRLFGKGRKTREVPIADDIAMVLKNYAKEEKKSRMCDKTDPMFCNRNKAQLTRAGIAYVLDKHFNAAKAEMPNLFRVKVHPHVLRHSRAMHWLEAGVDLYYIKDLLGHNDVETTEVYAKINTSMKRKVLEAVHTPVEGTPTMSWTEDKSTMDWLRSLSKATD
jgi:site-specific recombinase XerD